MKALFSTIAVVALYVVGSALATVLINMFSPLSQSSWVVSIVGFGLCGLFVGLSKFGPNAFRRLIARELTPRFRPTVREAVLWFLVAVVITGVLVYDRYINAF
jgi:hypothetical protein